jgi:DNA-binding response OmpR family regulator
MSRVRAALRRRESNGQHFLSNKLKETNGNLIIKGHGLEVDTVCHQVSLKGSVLNLTPKEFELLTFLMRYKWQVFSKEQLMEKLRGYTFEGSKRAVDVHIRWLRQKIEDDPDTPKILVTVIGFGYKFEN